MHKLKILFAFAVTVISTQIISSEIILENAFLKVGINENAGGAISLLSDKKTSTNFVNSSDLGRYIQLSLYGNADGSQWSGSPSADKAWVWNPVQAGSADHGRSHVLDMSQSKDEIYVKVNPRNWAGGQLLRDIVFEQWIKLEEEVVHVRYKATYQGSVSHEERDQEIPAIFLSPKLTDFAYSNGGKIITEKPGFPNKQAKVKNHWAAFLSGNHGVGVLTPGADIFTYYYFKDKPACAYMSPIQRFKISKGFDKEFDVYLTVGSLEEISARFAKINKSDKKSK